MPIYTIDTDEHSLSEINQLLRNNDLIINIMTNGKTKQFKKIVIKQNTVLDEDYYNDLKNRNIDKNGNKNNMKDYNQNLCINVENPDYTDSRLTFNTFLLLRENSKVFTYNHTLFKFSWLDGPEYISQFKEFRQLIKSGKLECIESLKDKEHLMKGIKYYSLALTEPSIWIDIGSLEIFSYMVQGFVYYFRSKTDRDNAYNYLTKKK